MLTINVRDEPFVARGDGTGDDTIAVQTAMDYAAATGRICFLPAGLYRVRQLVVPHGLILVGAHQGGYGLPLTDAAQTRLGLIAGTNAPMLLGRPGVAHVTISRVHLDGNKNNNTAGALVQLDDAVVPEEAQWRIRDVFVDAAAGDGVYVGAGRRAVQICDSTVNYSRGTGIVMAGSDGHITRCIVGSNGGHGIRVAASITRVYDCDIYGNGTDGDPAAGNGISVSSTITAVVVHGCGIDRNQRNGIFLARGSGLVTVQQCLMHSNSQAVHGGAHHVHVQTRTGTVSVTGCTFGADAGLENQPGFGIYLDDGARAYAYANLAGDESCCSGFCNAPQRLR